MKATSGNAVRLKIDTYLIMNLTPIVCVELIRKLGLRKLVAEIC